MGDPDQLIPASTRKPWGNSQELIPVCSPRYSRSLYSLAFAAHGTFLMALDKKKAGRRLLLEGRGRLKVPCAPAKQQASIPTLRPQVECVGRVDLRHSPFESLGKQRWGQWCASPFRAEGSTCAAQSEFKSHIEQPRRQWCRSHSAFEAGEQQRRRQWCASPFWAEGSTFAALCLFESQGQRFGSP